MVEPLPVLLSVPDVCRLFRRSERAIRDWVRRGHLTPVRIGRSVFFREDDLRAVIAGRLCDALRGRQSDGEGQHLGP